MDPLIPMFVRDEQDDDYDLSEAVVELGRDVGWTNFLREAFGVLARPRHKKWWSKATSIVYWAVSDGHELPFALPDTLAKLYFCLEQHPGLGETGLNDGENLVWSIASRLKGVGYLSEWNPLEEPGVRELMSQLRGMPASSISPPSSTAPGDKP